MRCGKIVVQEVRKSQMGVSRSAKIKVSWRLGVSLIPGLCQYFVKAACLPWLVVRFLLLSPSLALLPASCTYKDPCYYTEPAKGLQVTLCSTKLRSLT